MADCMQSMWWSVRIITLAKAEWAMRRCFWNADRNMGLKPRLSKKSGIRSGKSVVETVNVLLGRPYSIYGIVSKGKQLGRQLNLPTLNIYPPDSKLLPPNGVYASITRLDGKEYFGVTNLGVRPTLDDSPLLSVETNLFDYNDDAYGHYIEVQLMHFLRQEMKFDSIETLKKQMESDASFAREMFLLKN
mgnify:CR=1 FL=1